MSAQTRLEALKLAVSVKGLVGSESVMEAARLFDAYMNDVSLVAPDVEPKTAGSEVSNRRRRRGGPTA